MRARVAARKSADDVGAREWREMGGEKRPMDMSERSCADDCERCGCKEVAGNRRGEETSGHERA